MIEIIEPVLKTIAFAVIAYLLGSIPFAILVTRVKAGVDVRGSGSGHAGATNTMRAAGWAAGILVLATDIGKGYLAVWLAGRFGGTEAAPIVAAASVVIGHCWPIFAGFRGGMGMASGGGALLAVWPLGFVLAVGLGSALQLLIKHSARGNVVTGLLLMPLWALFGANWTKLGVALAVGIVISGRALADWSRVYRELWFDRE
ncbi:MAG: glycerol-3-phosphate acyltransferase [Anaerolineales bacterium]|nr:glycerol-3-phosphate acyltransferase [Anaerolineales bacterium]